ncbi:hypothetical protein AABB24_007613 [Solanum stoloniferum]|uniref:Uncharacterized protein n=1 Tax=Solanum stoloniferum TaxID=62892 RepID=A0ABD2UQ59_9SOLN
MGAEDSWRSLKKKMNNKKSKNGDTFFVQNGTMEIGNTPLICNLNQFTFVSTSRKMGVFTLCPLCDFTHQILLFGIGRERDLLDFLFFLHKNELDCAHGI